MTDQKSLQTIAAANGVGDDKAFGAVVPAVYLSTNYTFEGYDRPRHFDYSRTRNPSRDLLADTIAKLEGGADAIVTASGMAAIDLVLSELQPGDLIVAPHDCCGGTYRLIERRAAKHQFDAVFVNQGDEAAVRKALAARPKLLLMETPSNPLMRIVDIRALAAMAKESGTRVAVDNTFLSPALQRPISFGADFVIHSTTKYLNGHSDVIGGVVVTADASDGEQLRGWANITGVTGAAFDSYLTLRGIRTLFPRIERQEKNAAAVAAFLLDHAQVEAVYYPGLASHPGHAIAKRQQDGFGAMLSFELRGGTAAMRSFVEATRVFTLAESLGGVESLIAHPATMTHAGMGAEARAAAGISDALLRVSVGLEGERDLIDDLAQAFQQAR